MSKDAHHLAADRQREIQVYSRFNPHLIAHVENVLRGDVARRPWYKRAAADTGEAGIELMKPCLHSRNDIGNAKAAGIVEMKPPINLRVALLHLRADRVHLRRIGHPRRVGKTDLGDADVQVSVNDILDILNRNLTIPR